LKSAHGQIFATGFGTQIRMTARETNETDVAQDTVTPVSANLM
jgi:hypothetical protein